MEIVLHRLDAAGIDGFARLVRPVLHADPVRHTVALSVLEGLCAGDTAAELLLSLQDAGEVVGTALRTPSRPLLVSAVPPARAAEVVEAVVEVDPELRVVNGPMPEAKAFADAYAARTGTRVETAFRTRLHTLDGLVPPPGVPGTARLAGTRDAELLGEWRRAFADEEFHGWTEPRSPAEAVRGWLGRGFGEIIWDVDGEPVSQASARPVVAGTSRIGPVYTPPEHRRRGYAAAVTAAASRWALDAGARHVLLFTDAANATTNRLYPRLGYRAVHDAVDLRFVRPSVTSGDAPK